MSSLVRFLFSLAAAIAAASLLAASLRRRVQPPRLPDQLNPGPMAARNRSFVLWLHGLGDSGPANEPIRTFFSAPEFHHTKWAFPSAPNAPVSCNHAAVMPSWFDIHELPMSPGSPQDESGVLKAVENVHAMIDREVAAGIHPDNIFVCGFSQGGALTLASVLLYPKTLGGGAVFSGWVPFGSSVIERVLLKRGRHLLCGHMEWLTKWYFSKLVKPAHHFCKVQVSAVNLRHIQISATQLRGKS